MDKRTNDRLDIIAEKINKLAENTEYMNDILRDIVVALNGITHELYETLCSYKMGCALDAISSIGDYLEKLNEEE